MKKYINILMLAVCFTIIIYASYKSSAQIIQYDSINYIALGEHFALTGKTFSMVGHNYEAFQNGLSALDGFLEYPNYLYFLTIAFVSKFSGQGSVIPYFIINISFFLGFAIMLYFVCNFILNDKLNAAILTCLAFTNYSVFYLIFSVTPDPSLVFFLTVSILFSLHKKFFLCGLSMGIGFCFREQAIFFLPALPFFTMENITLKIYYKNLSKIIIAFLPGVLIKIILYFAIFYPARLYYISHEPGIINFKKTLMIVFTKFGVHLLDAAYRTGVVVAAPIFLFLCGKTIFNMRHKQFNIFVIILIIYTLLPMTVYLPTVQSRYYIYSSLFGIIALAFYLKNMQYNISKFLWILLISSIVIFVIPFTGGGNRYLTNNDIIKDIFIRSGNNTFLSSQAALPYYVQDNPFVIALPCYKDFLNGKTNNKIDYICLMDYTARDWPLDKLVITDKQGNKFELVRKFPSLDNCKIYKRI